MATGTGGAPYGGIAAAGAEADPAIETDSDA